MEVQRQRTRGVNNGGNRGYDHTGHLISRRTADPLEFTKV